MRPQYSTLEGMMSSKGNLNLSIDQTVEYMQKSLLGDGKEGFKWLDGAVLPDCSTGECCFVSRRL